MSRPFVVDAPSAASLLCSAWLILSLLSVLLAQFFIGSIAAFVLVTVALLAAAMRLQAIAVHSINADGLGNPTSISKSFFYPVYLLQAQSIVCE